MGVSRRHAVRSAARRLSRQRGSSRRSSGRRSSSRRSGAVAAAAVAGIAAMGALVISVLAALVARRILVPPLKREEDSEIVSIDRESGTVTFRRTPDATTDGRLSFWFNAAKGHAQIGRIVAQDSDSVTRELLRVDFGDIEGARRGRFNGWFYLYPSDIGVTYENVVIDTELGPAPAWLIEPEIPAVQSRENKWVIQVHGRATMRAETIRAVPVFRDAGYTSLLISYRNDFEAPASDDGRYSLGNTEWRDVEAALVFAHSRGAQSVVLMGWSMGGATVLQTVSRSVHADIVAGVVLESPVVDWVDALDYQARSSGVPRLLRALVYAMIGNTWGKPFTGLQEPIDLRKLDFVRRSSELELPTLILHSDDDDYVPSTASRALAKARSDIVTFELFTTARHTKLWNYDPTRWNRAIESWLSTLATTSR